MNDLPGFTVGRLTSRRCKDCQADIRHLHSMRERCDECRTKKTAGYTAKLRMKRETVEELLREAVRINRCACVGYELDDWERKCFGTCWPARARAALDPTFPDAVMRCLSCGESMAPEQVQTWTEKGPYCGMCPR